MTVLCLDAASTTGWARWDGPGQVVHGRWKLPDHHHYGRRFAFFLTWLDKHIQENGVRLVGYEQPFIGMKTNRAAIKTVVGVEVMIDLACAKNQVPVRPLNNRSVRAHFLGSYKAKRAALKAATIAQCQRLGWKPRDDNEADALACLHFLLCKEKIDHGLPLGPVLAAAE